MHDSAAVTELLIEMQKGSDASAERLYAAIFEQLRAMAEQQMRSERAGHTLQPTALVNEAYLKLVDQDRADWKNRDQFLAVASTAMRRILIDHARGRQRAKRGDGKKVAPLVEGIMLQADQRGIDLIELNDALEAFEAMDARAARVVELRFFGGLEFAQIARMLDVSEKTAQRDWTMARAWLMRKLSPDDEREERGDG